MVSRVLRRSGVALLGVAEVLEWKPSVIYQVGIGVHYEEVAVMQEAWPGVKLIGMEAHPDLANGLQDTYPGEFFHCAIGNSNGWVKLYNRPRHKDGASIYKRTKVKSKPDEENTVRIRKLDTLFFKPAMYGEPILLWLDCEGSELAAMQGGKEFLKSVDVINIEMTNGAPSKEWCNVIDTHKCLVENGFKRQTAHTNRTGGGQCDSVYVKEKLWRPQYCSCPISFIDPKCYM